ncbi:unnamed protein product [Linum trigynum]|uniref:Secreted protein n=1 Tax=Linum trigynum TaxID=586398 RepID=A0AAV2E1A8_9ROSI
MEALNSKTFFFISTTVLLISLFWPPLSSWLWPLKAAMMLCMLLAIPQQHQQQQYSSSCCSDAVSAWRSRFRGCQLDALHQTYRARDGNGGRVPF